MIISSRQNPPRMSLRRTASSNTLTASLQSPGQSRTTSSSTTTTKAATFLAPPLADSPLPSPVLPSIIPSYGKRPPGQARRKAIRLVSWMVMMFGLLQMVLWLIRAVPQVVRHLPPSLSPLPLLDGSYRLVEQLPDEAAPVVVVNRWERRKWTVWIPGSQPSPSEIEDLCAQCVEISRQLSHNNESSPFDYDHRDPNYLEVVDAQRMGILHRGPRRRGPHQQSGICESTLTFVLQSDEAGMGNTLLNLWLAYGLAQEQGRSFFIDDRNWAYGRYSTYFAPPPVPRCRPPPVSQRVPCPLQAKHLVVSTANAPYIFGAEFHKHYRRHGKSTAEQQRRIFELARAGYEALFHLSPSDAMYLQRREQQLDQETRQHGGIQIGIHVRRGDLHPLEPLYRESYLPLERYAEEAREALRGFLLDSESLFSLLGGNQGDDDTDAATTTALSSRMIVASDDPEVYNAPELQGAVKAQSYIWLASKSALEARRDSNAPPSPVDDAIGWEGGFFKDMFWSLGTPHIRHVITDKPSADKWRELGQQSKQNQFNLPPSPPSSPSSSPSSPKNPMQELKDNIPRADSASHRYNPSANVLALRELIGRAYLLDIAILAQTDHVICGISSVTCRLLAVMMGWDHAIAGRSWHNIDGGWDWTLTI